MTLLEKIVTELELAPEPLLVQVLDFIQENKVVSSNVSDSESSPRIPGLHQGKIWMSKDFNDSLPDEFLVGDDT